MEPVQQPYPPALESATGATAEVYAQIMKAAGNVPNTFATTGAHGPAALQADGVLAMSTLSEQDQETVKLLISEVAGCDHCVAAHTLPGKMTGLAPEVLKQMRAGQPAGDAERDALVRCVRDLAETGGTISDEAFSAIKAAGSTDQPRVDSSPALAVTVFKRINDPAIDFPAVA